MTPAPPAARRLTILGCAALAAAALTLSACGGSGDATAEGTTAATAAAETPPEAGSAGRPCPASLRAFVRSLDSMRRQLAVGLSYDQYAAQVGRLRRDYGEIPTERLTIACLTATGTPAEQAYNQYVDAVNAWGECLADAACATAAVEPVLQRRWRIASHFVSQASG
ncbi:MAG TPA: hypothetical protein VGO36_07040 [Solirubrobacterales bacterium]|jgi:hypothetical protein|nr:hypothetical protein [Solirubrobacterales bacterium]